MSTADLTTYEETLTTVEAAFIKATDPADRARELQEARAPFEPGGALQYAPPEYAQRAEADVKRKQDQRTGEALFTAEHLAREVEVGLESLIAAAKEPPDPEAAIYAGGRRDALGTKLGITLSEKCALDLLDEQRRARFDREYATALPSVMLADYKRALADPADQQNASFIRWVESRHKGQWNGAPIGDNDIEVVRASDLMKTIRATREARVPEDLRRLRDGVQRIYAKAEAEKRNGVRSLRPQNWGAR